MTFRSLKGGITAPKGFLASGMHAGIKRTDQLDLALIFSQQPGTAAGMFTRNRVAAAPVIYDRKVVKKGIGQAIIVNSGNANACTGAEGLHAAREMARATSRTLGIPLETVLVGSTGIIGHPLPIATIASAIPTLVKQLRQTGNLDAAKAIMTTDLVPKETAVRVRLGRHWVNIGGMAKGSGMIHPDMATMLAYITTDAAVDRHLLQSALRHAVSESFNCISVDGDTSTNDTVLVLANGLAGNPLLTRHSRELPTFQAAITHVCQTLALCICRDGEGKTKVVQIQVQGASTVGNARRVAQSIATSPLVKTALFGQDPNWGRIMAAVGRAGVAVNPQHIDLYFDKTPVVKNGLGLGSSFLKRAQAVMHRPEFCITVILGKGNGACQYWTTDLTYDYVRINTAYPT